jgi:hypothetical protein
LVARRLCDDGISHELLRRLVKQDLVHTCAPAEAGAADQGLAGRPEMRPAVAPRDDLARADPDATAELELSVGTELGREAAKRVTDFGGRSHSSQRIVLVQDGQPKDGGDRVAGN